VYLRAAQQQHTVAHVVEDIVLRRRQHGRHLRGVRKTKTALSSSQRVLSPACVASGRLGAWADPTYGGIGGKECVLSYGESAVGRVGGGLYGSRREAVRREGDLAWRVGSYYSSCHSPR
jgi:hypothetical protein